MRWVRAFAYPVKDASGTVREVVLVHEDVTDAHRGEERLRTSEGRLRLALAAGRMNAWDWNLATDVVECSENALAFWGIEVGSSADFLAVIHPDDLATVEEAGRAAMAGGDDYSVEYRLRSTTGVRWLQSRGRVDRGPDGAAARIFGVTVDITSLKAAEQTLQLLADAGDTLGASLDYHATLQHLAHLVVPRFADWFAVDMVTEDETLERVSVHHPDAARVALANELFARYPPRRDDPGGVWRVIDTGQPEWAAEIDDDMLQQGARDPGHLALPARTALAVLHRRPDDCPRRADRGADAGAGRERTPLPGQRRRAGDGPGAAGRRRRRQCAALRAAADRGSAQGRIPRHAGARVAQPAGAGADRPGRPAQPARRDRRRSARAR